MTIPILHAPIASKSWKRAIIERLAGWGGALALSGADALKFVYERVMLGGPYGGAQVADIDALQALSVSDISVLLARDDVPLLTMSVLDDGSGFPRTYVWVPDDTTAEALPYVAAPSSGDGRWFGLPSVDDAPVAGMFDVAVQSVLAADADTLGNIAVATKFTTKATVVLEPNQRGRVRAILDVIGGMQGSETLAVRVKVADEVVCEVDGLEPGDNSKLGVMVELLVRDGGETGEVSGIGTIGGKQAAGISGSVDLREPVDIELELEWYAQDAAHDVDLRELAFEAYGELSMPQHYTAALSITGGDNAEKAITVPTGLRGVDVLVDWGSGADGTVTLSRRYTDKDGAGPITIAVQTGISASAFVHVSGAAPGTIVAQRVGSSAGSVVVAILPRVQ